MTDPPDTLFRGKAIDHYLAAMERGEVVRVSRPSVWALVLVIVAAALALALLLWVDRSSAAILPWPGLFAAR